MSTNERLIQAVRTATRKLAGRGQLDVLLKDVLTICVEAVGAQGGTLYRHDPTSHRLRFLHVLPESTEALLPMRDMAEDFGSAGQAFKERRTVTREFPKRPESEWNPFERATGVEVRNLVAVPLMLEDEEPIGVVQLLNKADGPFNEADIAILETVASVSTLASVNARLNELNARASSLLGMGKVSHDIGNLAAAMHATLGFCTMALHGLGEHLRKKGMDRPTTTYIEGLEPMFGELQASVDRIVRYGRLISDLSAGRELEPHLTLAPLAETISMGVSYFESEADAAGVALILDVERDAPATYHDEVYVSRIVQNLVGNGIKAVLETLPDGEDSPCGDTEEVAVAYRYENRFHTIEVKDTGPGMTEQTIERILTGNARSEWDKASGSGWGTKIVLELTQALGGHVEITSALGCGTTFTVRLPHRDAA